MKRGGGDIGEKERESEINYNRAVDEESPPLPVLKILKIDIRRETGVEEIMSRAVPRG